jgi:hypothetical protein
MFQLLGYATAPYFQTTYNSCLSLNLRTQKSR